MKRILILGATSIIAIACAKQLMKKKAHFYLVGRNTEKLNQIKQDLLIRGASTIHCETMDMLDYSSHATLLQNAWNTLKEIDIVLIAHGSSSSQNDCEQDATLAHKEISTNGLSIISLLTLIANKMEQQKRGTIAIITSVAGDRGRAVNYVYGSAKALVNTFCEGLRCRLHKSGVQVLTIKPGFVETPMIHKLNPPRILIARPERIARDIIKAIKKHKKILYTPWYWQGIMNIIKMIPAIIYVKLKI